MLYRVVIITGNGRAFCAGQDLKKWAQTHLLDTLLKPLAQLEEKQDAGSPRSRRNGPQQTGSDPSPVDVSNPLSRL
ncbi:hypothetical protein FRC11_014602, partial [Ceratobasidium sp. 423]